MKKSAELEAVAIVKNSKRSLNVEKVRLTNPFPQQKHSSSSFILLPSSFP